MTHAEAWKLIGIDFGWIVLALLPLICAFLFGALIAEKSNPSILENTLCEFFVLIFGMAVQAFWVGSYFGWYK